jgi:hypothetical protein
MAASPPTSIALRPSLSPTTNNNTASGKEAHAGPPRPGRSGVPEKRGARGGHPRAPLPGRDSAARIGHNPILLYNNT